jgi:hypothetical protein
MKIQGAAETGYLEAVSLQFAYLFLLGGVRMTPRVEHLDHS